jgi:Fur family transcriptional regulator, peroxide stress response regulator
MIKGLTLSDLSNGEKELLERSFRRKGLRFTPQREHVFNILLQKRDHPTVDEVYARSKENMPGISLATVYNCLEALVRCELVKQVNIDREPSRYCPNLEEHAHFHCHDSGRVYDIDVPSGIFSQLMTVLPEGYSVDRIELSFHGVKVSVTNECLVDRI